MNAFDAMIAHLGRMIGHAGRVLFCGPANPSIRFIRFNAVGALGIGVQLATLWMLTEVAGVGDAVATAAAVGFAVVHNFAWHWSWTWRDRAVRPAAFGSAQAWNAGPRTAFGGLAGAFVRFAVANGAVSLVGSLAVMAALIPRAHTGPVAANAVAIVVCGLLNFYLGNEIVFRSSAPRSTTWSFQALRTAPNERSPHT